MRIQLSKTKLQSFAAIFFMCYFSGCKSINPLTKNLFLTTERVDILHQSNGDEDSSVLSEEFETNYQTVEQNSTSNTTIVSDSIKQIDLEEVAVIADKIKIKRIADQKGWLNLFFEIKAPAILLDSTWRLTVIPQLLISDSTTALPPLVLKGSAFKKKQENQYAAFNNILDSIVPTERYSELFLDKEKINEGIAFRRWLLYKSYRKELKNRSAYMTWKKKEEEKLAKAKLKYIQDQKNLIQNFKRNQSETTFETLIAGRDTTGIAASYGNKIQHELKRIKVPKALSDKKIPKKFRTFYANNSSTLDMSNRTLTFSDSAEIAQNRLKWNLIAQNEYNKENIETIKQTIITLPYSDSAIFVTTPNPDTDFKYMYNYRLPLKEGIRKLSVYLSSHITALDESSFRVAPSDTLTFVIASIAELYDRSLISSVTDSITYQKGVSALESRLYTQAAAILQPFNDYNYALALACSGESDKANKVLTMQAQSANVLYLRSILNIRLKNYQQASEYLISAIKIQPSLTNRFASDPEINQLFEVARNLKDIIYDISNNSISN